MNDPKYEDNRRRFIEDLMQEKETRIRVLEEAIRHTDCAWCKSQLSDLKEVLREGG